MERPDPHDAADADNWYAVQDLRQRKRIQNRLAQRARRMELFLVFAAIFLNIKLMLRVR